MRIDPAYLDAETAYRLITGVVVTIIGLQTGLLLSGAILTETVFAWGGMGQWMYQAINFRDYAVLQAGILLLAIIFVLVNLLVDITYARLDPRIRVR